MSNTDATPNQKIARDAELVTSHEDLADCINKLVARLLHAAFYNS